MEEKKEYFIVKDQDGNSVGKREVTSKEIAQNVHGLVINGSLIFSFGEFDKMQEEAENLPELK